MTLEKDKEAETRSALKDMHRILKKFNPVSKPGQFAIYTQFTHDVQGGESKLNRDIATELIK